MAFIPADQAGGQNRVAFLDMLAYSEIGTALLGLSDDGYNVLVGATAAKPLLFTSYATHPNVYNAALKSTAAGRYQILYTYWPYYQKLLNLPDFGKLSQDLYALQQMKERGALPLLDAGNLVGAVAACANIWASLPGNSYGQHQNDIDGLRAAYLLAGGAIS